MNDIAYQQEKLDIFAIEIKIRARKIIFLLLNIFYPYYMYSFLSFLVKIKKGINEKENELRIRKVNNI